jgi:hypothetical protein
MRAEKKAACGGQPQAGQGLRGERHDSSHRESKPERHAPQDSRKPRSTPAGRA